MKKILFSFFITCSYCSVHGQITIPVIKANFGVDADLRANYFNGAVNSAADDWYNNGTLGTGCAGWPLTVHTQQSRFGGGSVPPGDVVPPEDGGSDWPPSQLSRQI